MLARSRNHTMIWQKFLGSLPFEGPARAVITRIAACDEPERHITGSCSKWLAQRPHPRQPMPGFGYKSSSIHICVGKATAHQVISMSMACGLQIHAAEPSRWPLGVGMSKADPRVQSQQQQQQQQQQYRRRQQPVMGEVTAQEAGQQAGK